MTTTVPSDVQHRAGSLLDRYQVPPFSVLDTRQGYWQEARRAWLALGIRSELGRDVNLISKATERRDVRNVAEAGMLYENRIQRTVGRMGGDYDLKAGENAWGGSGTSVFDPVICELAYRWWCPPGGGVLDPFAGGSVRGIVAAWLGHPYIGVDLSAAQVASNREQADAILTNQHVPEWVVGDSRAVLPTLTDECADLIFTCPPYYDLEVYSDDPADLSAMPSWPAFLDAYGEVIGAALRCLRRDRFAAIVVSEIRGPNGIFRGLVPWTIRQFEMHGARYYNEAIIVNSAGTLPLRVGRYFEAGRKLGRSHQNLLVFVKGDVPKTHEWAYERTGAPAPQLEMFDIAPVGDDGRPL
jgi:hypothetical protein